MMHASLAIAHFVFFSYAHILPASIEDSTSCARKSLASMLLAAPGRMPLSLSNARTSLASTSSGLGTWLTPPMSESYGIGMKVRNPRTRSYGIGMNAPSPSLEHSQMPAILREWGMDDELWDKLENKKSFRQMAKNGAEEIARYRINKLRGMLFPPDASQGVQEESQEEQVANAAEMEANTQQATEDFFHFLCPANLPEDRSMRVALKDREFDVIVPEGVAAGETFLVGPFPLAS